MDKTPTNEQIEHYITAANLELGHECEDEWVGILANYLRGYNSEYGVIKWEPPYTPYYIYHNDIVVKAEDQEGGLFVDLTPPEDKPMTDIDKLVDANRELLREFTTGYDRGFDDGIKSDEAQEYWKQHFIEQACAQIIPLLKLWDEGEDMEAADIIKALREMK